MHIITPKPSDSHCFDSVSIVLDTFAFFMSYSVYIVLFQNLINKNIYISVSHRAEINVTNHFIDSFNSINCLSGIFLAIVTKNRRVRVIARRDALGYAVTEFSPSESEMFEF